MQDPIALGELLIPIAGIIGGASVAIVAIVTYHYRKSQRDDMEATLKMEMIGRGMSADEIERVLRARMEPCQEKSPAEKRAARRDANRREAFSSESAPR